MQTLTPEIVTAIASLLSFFAPLAIEAFKQPKFTPSQNVLLALCVTTTLYTGLHLLFGTFAFPLTVPFATGLLAVFGGAQVGYVTTFKERNKIVEVPVATSASPVNVDVTVDTKE